MRSGSSVDRLVVRTIGLCVVLAFVAGCMASAAINVASQTIATTARAAGAAARMTVDGARAVSRSIARPFLKDTSNDPAA